MWKSVHIASLSLTLLMTGACQTLAAGGEAQVNLADPATRTAVAEAVGKAVGRAQVQLGPQGEGWASVVTVLPPRPGPYEDRSPALPVAFDIRMQDGACVAVNRDTGMSYDLPGVKCAVQD